jgi:regulator of sigma E protease
MLLTALAFIFVLGVLIIVHEFGHFLVARWVGIRVERFSIGFPPHIYSFQRGETSYSIGLIPLGGYVKMAGENPDEAATGAPDEFMSKTVAQRTAVIFAGPFMNYVLAVLITIGIAVFGQGYVVFGGAQHFIGGEPSFDAGEVVVGSVRPDSPAAQAGMEIGDRIIGLDSLAVTDFQQLQEYVHPRGDQAVLFTWVHGNDTIADNLTPVRTPLRNESGEIDTVGLIGITHKPTRVNKLGFIESVQDGFFQTHSMVYLMLDFLKKLVTREVSPKLLGGPILIAQESGRQAREGFPQLLFFMALLSINLAVINLLPIPVLDGGHLVFLAIEKIIGAPLSMRARMVAQQVGLVVLLTAILFVTYNDILRVIRGTI